VMTTGMQTESTAGHPRPDHGRQPATVKGKASAALRRSLRSPLDERRQTVGMNRTVGAGSKCRGASTVTTGARGPSDQRDQADRAFIREACLMLQRIGYKPTISGRRIKAKKDSRK
jgi:hypothetical protein